MVLRNALSEQLAARHGTLAGHWYDDPLGVLSVQAVDDIAAARRRVAKLRRGESPGRLIAELNFGFGGRWVGLRRRQGGIAPASLQRNRRSPHPG